MPDTNHEFTVFTDLSTGRQTADAKDILRGKQAKEDINTLKMAFLDPELVRKVFAFPVLPGAHEEAKK